MENEIVKEIMEGYNHSSISITRKYIGIDQQELDEVYIIVNL